MYWLFGISVKQLHKDYQRAGSNALQIFSFHASEATLKNTETTVNYTVSLLFFYMKFVGLKIVLPKIAAPLNDTVKWLELN